MTRDSVQEVMIPSSTTTARALAISRPAALVALAALAVCAAGCPTFESTYSGTYVEEHSPEAPSYRVVEVFRAGDDVMVYLRTFERDPTVEEGEEPFRESLCEVSRDAPFDEETRSFRVELPSPQLSDEERLLRIEIDEGGSTLEATLEVERGGSATTTREFVAPRASSSPSTRCSFVEDYQVAATFGVGRQHRIDALEPSRHLIDNPVFAIAWVGLDRIQVGDQGRYVRRLKVQSTRRLGHRGGCEEDASLWEGYFDADRNGFYGGSLWIPDVSPPPGEMLTESGESRFGLGHFVVFDDGDCAGFAGWNPGQEPILANSLDFSAREQAPPRANGHGSALFFVEGSLRELAPSLQQKIEIPAGPDGSYLSLDEADEVPRGHFYLAEIDFRNDELLRIRLPETLSFSVDMRVDASNLDQGDYLPRLFPR